MISRRIDAVLFGFLLLSVVGCGQKAVGFFESTDEFWIEILEPRGPSGEVQLPNWPEWMGTARYLGYDTSQSSPGGTVVLQFELQASGKPLAFLMDEKLAVDIPISKGADYDVAVEVHHGFPSTFGLLIKDQDGIVFQGVTDWDVGKQISIEKYSPIKVHEVTLLADHFKEPEACYERITNTEVTFAMEDASISLHQGGSGELGSYLIALWVARSIEYSNDGGCLDSGINGISYTIRRSSTKKWK